MLFCDLLEVLSPSYSIIELRESKKNNLDTYYIGTANLKFLKTDRFSDLHNREIELVRICENSEKADWVVILKYL